MLCLKKSITKLLKNLNVVIPVGGGKIRSSGFFPRLLTTSRGRPSFYSPAGLITIHITSGVLSMETRPLQERLDEVTINSQADIKVIAESIYFYWNLARHKGEPIVVEVWGCRKNILTPKLEVPPNGKVLVAGESSWNN